MEIKFVAYNKVIILIQKILYPQRIIMLRLFRRQLQDPK